MAISATFAADYSAFIGPTKAATVELTKLVGKTDAVAAGMTRAGQAAAGAAGPTTSLTSAFHDFDGVLASLGIHIGPEVKGLEDLSAASGKTASQMGILGTAGLVVGAATAGWKLGRMAAEFLGTDVAIGNATAKLLGWGDAVGEAAGAKQDTINKAIAAGADIMISYTDAIAFNTKEWKRHNEAVADVVAMEDRANEALAQMSKVVEKDMADAAAEALKFQEALGSLAAVGTNWKTTLEQLDGETVNAIRYYTEAGVSQADLAEAYGLTAGQIRAVVSALGDEKVAIDAATAAEKARAAANAKVQEERAAIQPNSKYGTNIKYGQNPGTAYSDIAPAVTGPGRGAPGTVTVTINAVGMTPADLTRQIEAELVKSAKLKGFVGH